MSVSHVIYETTPFSPEIPPLPQFRELHQKNHFDGIIPQLFQPATEEPSSLLKRVDSREVTNLPKSSCLYGLTSGIAASFLTKNPLLLLLGLSECFPRASAQQKVGSEFQVNAYIISSQIYSSVATFDNGNFVVTWASYGQDGSNFGIFAQLFHGNGSKFRSEFQVNIYTASFQQFPSVATFNNDNFVVTWESDGQDGDRFGVFGQLFDENGAKIRGEFRVNTFTGSYQFAPSTATFKNDNFVVTWTSDGQGGGPEIYGQLFYGNGTKMGGEFHVNTYTSSNQEDSSVATFSNGNFVATWESDGQDGDGYGIYGQLFNSNTMKIGNEFRVNNFTTSDQYYPSVATFSNDNFVVTWDSSGQDGSGFGIFAQLFHGNGSKFGSEFQVNAYTTNAQRNPAVATFSNGNFVITWHSDGQDGHYNGVFGQLFTDNATKIGREFQANTNFIRDQDFPSVASFTNGNFVVTWNSDRQDGEVSGIYGQIFHDNTTSAASSTIFPTTNSIATSSSTSSLKSTTTRSTTTSSTTSSLNSSTTVSSSSTTTSSRTSSVSSSTTVPSTSTTTSSRTSSVRSSTTVPSSSTTTSSRTSSVRSSTTVPSTTRPKTTRNSRATFSTTSDPRHRFSWIWFLLGSIGAISCLGLTGYYIFKSRNRKKDGDALALDLGESAQPKHSAAESDDQSKPDRVKTGDERQYGRLPDHSAAETQDQRTPDFVRAGREPVYGRPPDFVTGRAGQDPIYGLTPDHVTERAGQEPVYGRPPDFVTGRAGQDPIYGLTPDHVTERAGEEPLYGSTPHFVTERAGQEPTYGLTPDHVTERAGQEPIYGLTPDHVTERAGQEPIYGLTPDHVTERAGEEPLYGSTPHFVTGRAGQEPHYGLTPDVVAAVSDYQFTPDEVGARDGEVDQKTSDEETTAAEGDY